MNKFLLVGLGLLLINYSAAQDLDESCLPPSKKIGKLITAAKKSENIQDVRKNFDAAIKLDEDNATAYFEFGLFYYKYAMNLYRNEANPMQGDKALNSCKYMMEKVIDLCPEFHADAYYYL